MLFSLLFFTVSNQKKISVFIVPSLSARSFCRTRYKRFTQFFVLEFFCRNFAFICLVVVVVELCKMQFIIIKKALYCSHRFSVGDTIRSQRKSGCISHMTLYPENILTIKPKHQKFLKSKLLSNKYAISREKKGGKKTCKIAPPLTTMQNR